MAKGTFSIFSKVQDVEVHESDIRATSDYLNSYLIVPIKLLVRLPNPNNFLDFYSYEPTLYFGNEEMFCSYKNIILGRSCYGDSELQLEIEFELKKNVVSQIEKFRNDDLQFKIKTNFLIAIKDRIELDNNKIILSSNYIQNLSAQVQFVIPKSQWIEKILPQLGYNNIRLIEVPKTHNQLEEEYQSVYSVHVDPLFWDVDPPAKQAIRVRA